ncbi:MAG: glycosyltransferase [Enterovibrio sp.]
MLEKSMKVIHLALQCDEPLLAIFTNLLQSSPENVEHVLLAHVPRELRDLLQKTPFQEAYFCSSSKWLALCKVLTLIKKLKPDALHLHGAKAGFLAPFLAHCGAKIIYTPHCYLFERHNYFIWQKKLYLWLEKERLHSIDVVAATNARDFVLAKAFHAKKTLQINGYSDAPAGLVAAPCDGSLFNVVMVGELSEQSGVPFLVKMIEILKGYSAFSSLRFYWIGGGPLYLVQRLQENGVVVSGSLERSALLQQMQKAHLYLHTNAWDSMPLPLLDAAKLCIPSLVRFSSAMQGIAFSYLAPTPKAMAMQVLDFVKNKSHEEYLLSLNVFNKTFTMQQQQETLKALYSL